MRVLFGTDGIRGKAHRYPLDPPTIFALGEAMSHRLRKQTGAAPQLVVGMDTRESGPEIANTLAAGIIAGGGQALFIGVAPTPAVAYLCRVSNAAAGISVSASHNPFDDNGLKIFGHNGMKLGDAIEEEIENELRALRHDEVGVPAVNLAPDDSLIRKYEDFLLSCVAPNALAGMRVVLDTGNGAAYRIAPEVFRRAGADVTIINDQPNGMNINDNAGAMHPQQVARAVIEERADLGVALDGDADRAICTDDRGRIRNGDEIIYLWAQKLRHEGKLPHLRVVGTVMSNFGFERQLRHDGIELLRANVGDKYVLELMLQCGAILGGEQSGHIIDLSMHTTGDGTRAGLAVAELAANAGGSLCNLPSFTATPQVLRNEYVPARPPLESLPRFQAAAAEAERELDGNGRILVRYSGSESMVRVMVEGPDEAITHRIAGTLADILKEEIR